MKQPKFNELNEHGVSCYGSLGVVSREARGGETVPEGIALRSIISILERHMITT